MSMRLSFAHHVVGFGVTALGLIGCAMGPTSESLAIDDASSELASTGLLVEESAWEAALPSCEGIAFLPSARLALAENAPALGVVVDEHGIACVDTIDTLSLLDIAYAPLEAEAEIGALVPLIGTAPIAGDPSPQPNRPQFFAESPYLGRTPQMGDPSPQPNSPDPDEVGVQTNRSATR